MPTTTATSLTSKCEPEVVLSSVSMHLQLPPPPSHPNTSRRWFFWVFRCTCHDNHLSHVQMRARGGSFVCFDMPTTTTTSCTSKCEQEVVFFSLSTCLPAPAPPSHSNVSQRLCFLVFRCIYQHHHLPHIKMRAGGGFFRIFQRICHYHIPRIPTRAGGGHFQ